MELTYTRIGDYYIPDLTLGEQPDKPLGKYGRMHQQYLKDYYPGTYNRLVLSGKLWTYLSEIDTICDKTYGHHDFCNGETRGCDRRIEGVRSHGLGGPHEQHPQSDGRNCSS